MGVAGNEASGTLVADFSCIDRVVVALFVLVEYVGVSVREGTSFNILARKADVVSFIEKGGKSQSLSSSPVNTLSSDDSLLTLIKDLNDLGVELGAFRKTGNLFTDGLDGSQINT
jgi:hypothetical protein